MPQLHPLAALAAASAALACAASAAAAPVTVNVRVEASAKTLYEGNLATDAKTLNKDGTDHPCDGTNGGANTTPGATATGALDVASIAGGFTWDATWDSGYEDFLISRIGPDTNTGAPTYQPYWGVFVNYVAAQVGGCQQRVGAGDNVLWAYASYGDPLLRLTAPARAATGESFSVTVDQTDGSNGTFTPAVGASVEGKTTDATGHATVSYSDPGAHTFKAARSGAVRSNPASVCVYTPGSGDCGTEKASSGDTQTTTTPSPAPEQSTAGPVTQPAAKDTTPPVVRVTSLVVGKDYNSGPRLLTGDVDEAVGIHQVFLRLRAADGHGSLTAKARCRWFSGKRGVFTHRIVPCGKARFFRIGDSSHWSYLLPARLGEGTYTLDVKVLDTTLNAGRESVPFGVR